MLQAALEGLKVIDLTHYVAGPCCTKMLADYGADVIKVERPGVGDGARRLGPFPDDQKDPERSALFLHLNANKRGMTLDLKKPEGAEVLKRMVKEADILVESFQPRVMPSLGLGYEVLDAINPQLVMVSVSNFGQTGPYRDYRGSEIVDYALGGSYYTGGLPDREPVKLGGTVVSYLAGFHSAGATVVAVLGSSVRGYGDHVDVSIMETQAGSPDRRTPMIMGYQFTGDLVHRGEVNRPPVRPCGDGYMNIQAGIRNIKAVADMLEMPELLDDPRFTDEVEAQKPENLEEMEAIVLGWLLEHTMSEAWATAQKFQIASGPIYTVADILADRHYQERGFWEEIDHPAAGRLRYTGRPFRAPGEPSRPRRPAPLLGEHTDEVLKEFGYDAKAIAGLRQKRVL